MSNTAHMAAAHFNTTHRPGTPVKAYPGLRTDPPLVTRTRNSAWVMPSGTAVVSVHGYAGGIALDHIEVDETRRPAPSDLEFRAPDCPLCNEETESDGDSFRCEDCAVSWGRDGRNGEWDDPEEPGCRSVIEPHNRPGLEPKFESIRHRTERCVLPLNHSGKHRPEDEWLQWDDNDPRVVSDAEAVPA